MHTSPGDLTPHEMRTAASEALALLRQHEQKESDESGERARWITALEVLSSAAPHEVPQDAAVLTAVTQYLELLAGTSFSPSIDDDEAIAADTADWGHIPDDDHPAENILFTGEPTEPREQEIDRQLPAGPWPPLPSRPKPASADKPVPEQSTVDDSRDEENDIERLEEAVARLEALKGGTWDGKEVAAQRAGLLELKTKREKAQVEVRAAAEDVSFRELNAVHNVYGHNGMSEAQRQIDMEERRIQLNQTQMELSERESERRYALERQRLEFEHDEKVRELALRQSSADADTVREDKRLAVAQQSAALKTNTVQLFAGASAITTTGWLAGLSLVTTLPFLTALGLLFLLTVLSLGRTRALGSTENSPAALSWTDGVRAVPLLPVAAFLVATSAVFALVSVLTPREQRKQLNGYAHRTLHSAERILLGR